jgi:hypothetical protein
MSALPRVNLPAHVAFVNPDSAHHGPRHEAGGASIIPLMQQRPSTRRAAAPGPMPVERSAARPSTAGIVASGASIKAANPASRSTESRSMPATCPAARLVVGI